MKTKSALQGVLGALVLVPAVGMATPVLDTFGPLDATFGGTEIPNEEVASARTFVIGGSTSEITVAMSATQRYSNPALNNDDAGTYFATPGSNFGGAGESTTEGALWNFNYYINIESTTEETLADYQITLFYDFDPAFDNGPINGGAGLGSINVTNGILASATPTATKVEGSQNLMFGFLASSVNGFVSAPTGVTAFDPNALGEYNFAIAVSKSGFPVESVAIDVQVVPIPAAVWLFGSALVGLAGISRRKQKA